MAVVQHNTLTASSLHELKGAAAAAVDTVPIADGAGSTTFDKVDTDQIADNAITTPKIADLAVTEPKLADNSVSNRTIIDGAVTVEKLGPGAFRRTINTQTGTTYQLQLTDAVKYIRMNNASANTITLVLDALVAFEIGAQIDLFQAGVGATSVAGAVGVTINGVSAGSATLGGQFSGATLIKVDTNEWDLVGDHGGVT